MIRVALVDDQTLVREGIRSLLALSDEIRVVGEGADGDDALSLVASGDLDVLLLDLRMPRRDGIAALEALAELGSTVPVLVLTTFDDDELVLRALRAGAKGYLLKDVTLDQLVEAIKTLAGGGTLLQPGLTDRLFRAVQARPPGVTGFARPEPLTPRACSSSSASGTHPCGLAGPRPRDPRGNLGLTSHAVAHTLERGVSGPCR
jgi:DNA-binding NarL/FixJ family response regulator